MFEKTNQAEENTAFENQESGIEEAFIEGAMEEDTEASADTDNSGEEKYKVKYNGEEVELSLEELKTNAQKGMNYDHIKGELDTLKGSKHLRLVEELSEKYGKSPEELVRGLADDMDRRELERLKQSGIGEGDAKDLMAAKNDIDDFVRNFPDVDPRSIPTDVFKLRDEGRMSLGMAYAKVMNNRLISELKTHEQNEKNARASVGSALSEGSSAESDPFLAGMMGY